MKYQETGVWESREFNVTLSWYRKLASNPEGTLMSEQWMGELDRLLENDNLELPVPEFEAATRVSVKICHNPRHHTWQIYLEIR